MIKTQWHTINLQLLCDYLLVFKILFHSSVVCYYNSKMQLQLINNRITPIIEGNFSDRQMRLRKGKGTKDAFFISELNCVSKKTSKIIFVITTLNFHQIWQFLAQWWQIVQKLYEVHSFSTSLTSMHYRVKRRCYKLLHNAVIISSVNFQTTKLAYSKPKYNLFSRMISLYITIR